MNEDALVRFAIVGLALAFLMQLEWLLPARHARRGRRWLYNLGLGGFNTLLALLLAPVGAFAAAHFAREGGFGLLNMLAVPGWAGVALTLVVMDAAIYWQHRAMHRFAPLWRLHRLHHADTSIDVTSGVRFHPAEIAVSLVYQAAIVLLLGAPPAGVLAFATLLTVASLFEHSDIRLPPRIERPLRWLLVTPQMHLVHHGAEGGDLHHNFGFCLSLWDRLWGSYRPAMTSPRIGLA